MHISRLFSIIVLLFSSSVIQCSEEFKHFSQYTANVLANIVLPVATVAYAFNYEGLDSAQGCAAAAGSLFFGSLTLSKIIETYKEAKKQGKLFKTMVNAGADMTFLIASALMFFDKNDGSPVFSGICLAAYIMKYIRFNRAKKEALATDTDNVVLQSE